MSYVEKVILRRVAASAKAVCDAPWSTKAISTLGADLAALRAYDAGERTTVSPPAMPIKYGPPGRQVDRPEDCPECGRGASVACKWCVAALRTTSA